MLPDVYFPLQKWVKLYLDIYKIKYYPKMFYILEYVYIFFYRRFSYT